ncbi:unnamed protein product [Ixodes pacificus]
MKCEPSLTVKGTLVKVETICKDAHYHTWSSQPVIKGKAAGSLLLSSAIFFSGASPTATLRVLQLMNVQVMTLRMYFNYQSAFLIPTVEKVWKEHQDELLEQLKDSPVDLSVDGRCDSPGFSAKYLTHSVYAPQINKILHCERVQVGECEEVRANVQIEKQVLIRCLEFLKTNDIKVRSLTTDQHRSIAKHMREVEPEVVHYFDVWHVSKSIKKAITAASKAPGCSALDVWVQAAANHMHWCAAASRGNGDLLVEAWASIARHVADIHNGHGGLYTTCLHGTLDDVEWLSPGMPSHDKFTAIMTSKRLLKDLRQLPPDTPTFSLESFHNVLNGFAPKSTAFSPEGMLARTCLAALHFNDNAEREQAITKDGDHQWKGKKPKARKGHHVVCPVKTEITYGYVQKLMAVAGGTCGSSTFWRSSQATRTSPKPKMSDRSERPSKKDLIDSRVSRFAKAKPQIV